ncbi:D-beta-hydroxybutyrate dehydrogenase, mitochondrial isoform X3 [Columba livia]|uniref:D-beta-hydroxybutyrate dehydrogenase, mitochondrial isoform X3 n=1 Tax=Columba livia TaxID=8932 RepID=UPI0031BAE5CC
MGHPTVPGAGRTGGRCCRLNEAGPVPPAAGARRGAGRGKGRGGRGWWRRRTAAIGCGDAGRCHAAAGAGRRAAADGRRAVPGPRPPPPPAAAGPPRPARLWGLVNNAGISTFGEVEFATLDNYKNVAEINLWGTVRVTKAFLPLIRRAKGRVVNITSMLGRMVSPSRSCYCISKFGVAAFSDCLRQEMYRWGVRVILIEPSNFVAATGILTADGIDKQAEALWSGASDTVQEDYGREYFTRHVALMKSFINSGLKDMSLVLNDITDALTSTHPNNRYNPMETYWWVRLQVMTHLPTAIADWLYVPGATL